jgi:perosamine synthetase
MDEPAGCRSNYWLSTIALRTLSLAVRDRLLTIANDNGLMARPAWTLLSRLPMYAECPAAPLPAANRLEAALINLPSGPSAALGVRA